MPKQGVGYLALLTVTLTIEERSFEEQHIYGACRKHAFGQDELLPLSQTSNTWFDLGLTLLDSLDTLLLLGLDAEYDEVGDLSLLMTARAIPFLALYRKASSVSIWQDGI